MTRPRTPRAATVTLSRDDRAILRSAAKLHVVSCADGTLRVTPTWNLDEWAPPECRAALSPKTQNYCERCQCNHVGGMMTRMALADVIERVLGAVTPRPARKARGRGR